MSKPGVLNRRESLVVQLVGAGLLSLVSAGWWLGWRGVVVSMGSLIVGGCYGVVHELARRAREVEQLGREVGHQLHPDDVARKHGLPTPSAIVARWSARETAAKPVSRPTDAGGVVQEPPASGQLLRQAVHCCCGRVCLTEEDWLFHKVQEPTHRPERVFSTFDCG